MRSNGRPTEAASCAERACPFPPNAGSAKGYCGQHSLMFEGGWPIRQHNERNVTAAQRHGIALDRPGNLSRHARKPAHA